MILKRAWNEFLTLLALVFLVSYAYPAFVTETSARQENLISITQWICWGIFAIDFVVGLFRAKSKKNFIRTHWLEFLTVLLPFFRAVRILRLITMGSFVIERVAVGRSLRIAVKVALTAFFLAFVSAVQLTLLERAAPNSNIHSFGDGMWWALTTVTTVGYGDRFPVTTDGRIIAFGLMIVGISLIGVITASVAAWFVELNNSDKSQS